MLVSDILQTPGLKAELDLIRNYSERLPNKNKVGCFMLFIVKIVLFIDAVRLLECSIFYLLCYYLLFFFLNSEPEGMLSHESFCNLRRSYKLMITGYQEIQLSLHRYFYGINNG